MDVMGIFLNGRWLLVVMVVFKAQYIPKDVVNWPQTARELKRGRHPYGELKRAGKSLSGNRLNATWGWDKNALKMIESPDAAKWPHEEKNYHLRAKTVSVRTWVDKEPVDMSATGFMVHVGHLELILRDMDPKTMLEFIAPIEKYFYYEKNNSGIMVSYEETGWGFTGSEALEHVYYPNVPSFDYVQVRDGVVRKIRAEGTERLTDKDKTVSIDPDERSGEI